MIRAIGLIAAASLLMLSACSSDTAASGDGDATVLGEGDVSTDGVFTLPDGRVVDDADESDAGGPTLDAIVESDTGGGGEEDGGGGETDTGGGGGEEIPGRFDSCGFGDPCPEPLQCLGTCQLPCDAGCAEDEECIELGGGFGVCGQEAEEGERCELTEAAVCADDLFCNDDNECEAPDVVGEGDDCGGDTIDCGDGLICVGTGRGEGVCHEECGDGCGEDETCVSPRGGGEGACFESCDPDAEEDTCPDGYECREQIGGGEVACLAELGGGGPGGGGGTGEEADFAEPCGGGGSSCSGDMFCPPIGGSYCTQTCETVDDCPSEPAGAQCVSAGWGPGLCTFTCEGGGECPEGMDCQDLWGQAVCGFGE